MRTQHARRGYLPWRVWHRGRIDPADDENLVLDAVDHIVLEARAAIGQDPDARFALFRWLLAIAQQAAGSGYLS